MEAASILTSSSLLSTNHHFTFKLSYAHSSSSSKTRRLAFPNSFCKSSRLRVENDGVSFRRRAVKASGSVIEEEEVESGTVVREKDTFPKVDKAEPGYEFDKNALLKYDHMSFGGPPVAAETFEEADELLHIDEMESALDEFTRKLLVAIVEKWDAHALIINKVAPADWKNEPAGRILELCILHLAMSEIEVLRTSHRIVINEAVDLAKRFCDGAAPGIINGCLRTYVKDHGDAHVPRVAFEPNKEQV